MVHYQSRAQVPAPCVGKPRRPPVLQVSTIQTPPRGGLLRRGHGRGARQRQRPPLAGFSFFSLARAASLGCRPRS